MQITNLGTTVKGPNLSFFVFYINFSHSCGSDVMCDPVLSYLKAPCSSNSCSFLPQPPLSDY